MSSAIARSPRRMLGIRVMLDDLRRNPAGRGRLTWPVPCSASSGRHAVPRGVGARVSVQQDDRLAISPGSTVQRDAGGQRHVPPRTSSNTICRSPPPMVLGHSASSPSSPRIAWVACIRPVQWPPWVGSLDSAFALACLGDSCSIGIGTRSDRARSRHRRRRPDRTDARRRVGLGRRGRGDRRPPGHAGPAGLTCGWPAFAHHRDLRSAWDCRARFLAEGQIAQVATFAGVRLDISDFPTRHPYGLGLRQNHIERILACLGSASFSGDVFGGPLPRDVR